MSLFLVPDITNPDADPIVIRASSKVEAYSLVASGRGWPQDPGITQAERNRRANCETDGLPRGPTLHAAYDMVFEVTSYADNVLDQAQTLEK